MNVFFFDTSALGKRYVPEVGTAEVNHLIDGVSRSRLFMLTQALGETRPHRSGQCIERLRPIERDERHRALDRCFEFVVRRAAHHSFVLARLCS